MKLKIVEPGWTNFSGDFGGVEFVDNVSVREVTEREAYSLSNLVRIETLDGSNPSSSQQQLDIVHVAMDTETFAEGSVSLQSVVEEALSTLQRYDRDALQGIADSKGIEGLRAIATPMSLQGKSINALISSILNAQGIDPLLVGLYGSSTQPASFLVNGTQVSLGSVVRSAFELFEKGNKTATEWNALPAATREQFISDQVALIRD